MGTALGRRHGRNGQIIELTRLIGRTPGALAMKACNFASLDPKFRLTERKGLSGASEAGRVLWREMRDQRFGGQGVTGGQPHHPMEPVGETACGPHQRLVPQCAI